MNWRKLGKIFCPDNNYDWMMSHASNPVSFILDEAKEIVRIFFSTRDKDNHASIAYVDVDFKNNYQIIKVSNEPVLSPGQPGYFDDDGVSMSWLTQIGNKYFLYYLGWNLRVTVPWLNTIGLAISNSIDGSFEKYGKVPLLDRSNDDPFTVSYPCVIFDKGMYRMWYGSSLNSGKTVMEMVHIIKYAESADGIIWNRTNQIHITFMHPGEYTLSKPCVVKFADGYRMWYSYRGNEKSEFYRIGMAVSSDGYTWTRKDDEAGIDVSAEGWDSQSIEYSNVFKLNEKYYMLYNGNGYGKTGFGIAVAEND